jgi:hypothetical protein
VARAVDSPLPGLRRRRPISGYALAVASTFGHGSAPDGATVLPADPPDLRRHG